MVNLSCLEQEPWSVRSGLPQLPRRAANSRTDSPPLILMAVKQKGSPRTTLTTCVIMAVVGLVILVAVAVLGGPSTTVPTLLGVVLPCLVAWSLSMLALRESLSPTTPAH
jgi:hypothetical protein